MSTEWKDSDDPTGGDRPWEKAEEDTELGFYPPRVPNLGMRRLKNPLPPMCYRCKGPVEFRPFDGAKWCDRCGLLHANFTAFVLSLRVVP